ncbi:MAG: YncE family protein [Anaerolineae bacterium]
MKRVYVFLIVSAVLTAVGLLTGSLQAAHGEMESTAGDPAMSCETRETGGVTVRDVTSTEWISLGLRGADWSLVGGPGVWRDDYGYYLLIDHQAGTTTLEAALPVVLWPEVVELGVWVPVHSGTNGTWEHRIYVEFEDDSRVYSDWITRTNNDPLQLSVMFFKSSGTPVKIGQQFRSDGNSWLACWPETANATSYRQIVASRDAWLPAEATGFGFAGSTVVYTETLTNLSDESDSFTLTLGSHVWTTTLSLTQTGVLAPGARVTLTARVEIPVGAGQGASDVVILRAASSLSPTLVSTATLTTRVPRPGYVFNTNAKRINILDTISHADTGLFIDTTPYGRPYDGSLSPDGRWLYTTLFAGNSVLVINAITHTPVMTIPVGSWPMGIAFSPDGQYAFVANMASNSVSVIDVDRQMVTAAIPVGNPPYYVAVSPCLRKVYVTIPNSDSVSVIDMDTLTVTNVITGLSVCIGVTFSPQGDRAYVGNQGALAIGVIDTASESVIATWPVLGSNALEIAPSVDGGTLYIGERTRVRVVSAVGPGAGQVITAHQRRGWLCAWHRGLSVVGGAIRVCGR